MHLPACPHPAPVLIGFSGGLDSTVLLHLLAQQASLRVHGLRALHVHHGLHPDANHWAAHCEQLCAALRIPFQIIRVTVPANSGLGLEAAAREARHAAFTHALQDGEVLALAHHQDDQAETFLLRALRGAGCDGLAAMRPWRRYAQGWLWRPLLQHPRAALRAYANAHGLPWIEDPSNASSDFDRNFLRNIVLPHFAERWPQATRGLARSATLCAEASDLLLQEDTAALAHVQRAPDALEIAALQPLSPTRRSRVLRAWINALALPPLPQQGVQQIERALLHAEEDAQARFRWQDVCVQRWRGLLYVYHLTPVLPEDWACTWDGAQPLLLPSGTTLSLHGAARFDAALRVHARQGGERILLPKRAHSHSLKHVLQTCAIPPWQRERLPLLSAADGTLLAAGDQILSATLTTWLKNHGAHLSWQSLP